MECDWSRCCNKFTTGISMALKAFIREGTCMGGHLYGRALVWEGTYMGGHLYGRALIWESLQQQVCTRSSKV